MSDIEKLKFENECLKSKIEKMKELIAVKNKQLYELQRGHQQLLDDYEELKEELTDLQCSHRQLVEEHDEMLGELHELRAKVVKDITPLQLDLVKWWCGYAWYELLVIHSHFGGVRLTLRDLQVDEIKYFTLKELLDEMEDHLDNCIGECCYCGDEEYDDFIHNKMKQVVRAIEELK